MGKINLLVANAGNTFTDNEITLFQRAVNAAEEYLTTHQWQTQTKNSSNIFLLKCKPQATP